MLNGVGKHGLLVVVGVGIRMLNGVGETWVVGCSWSRYKDVKRGGGNMGCWL